MTETCGENQEATLRALDRKVAEGLGWTEIRPYGDRLDGFRPVTVGVRSFVPLYSAEMSDAWECVEWLRKKGWGYMLHDCTGLTRGGEPNLGHWAGFAPGRYCKVLRGAESQGKTPAEAICRAFLAVLEANPELRGKR